MISFVKRNIPASARRPIQRMRDFVEWHRRGYAAPSPAVVKQRVLLRNGSPAGTWVETGTYLGDTTEFLSRHAQNVITIEPEPTLYCLARKRFARDPKVEVVNGTSESVFPSLLCRLNGSVNFWLDGHYSGGTTWPTFKGASDTPIIHELSQIEANLSKYQQVCVLIDDIRSFESAAKDSQYPRLDYLIDWSRRNSLIWHIEHDIFVAKNCPPV